MKSFTNNLKYYCKFTFFKIFSCFSILLPQHHRFKSAISKLSFDKPVAVFFFGTYGYGGAENYTNSIIDEINSKYHCLLVVESKSANFSNQNFQLISLEDFSHIKLIQYTLIQDLLYKITPNICVNITSANFFRAYIANRRNILDSIGGLYISLFSRESFVGIDSKVIKNIYTDVRYILSDNQRVIDDLQNIYFDTVIHKKNICLYNKVNLNYNNHLFESNLNTLVQTIQKKDKIKLLWASRLDQDKNLQLLFDFANVYQNIHIDVYGSSMFNNVSDIVDKLFKLPNIKYGGKFNKIENLLDANLGYFAFMFTSYWEGLPNTLLEVGLCGFPILAPDVGGINELINDTTGYLVNNNIDSYFQGLQSLINNVKVTETKARNLRDLILYRHSIKNYRQNIKKIFL